MSDTDRILKLLQERGARGVTSYELRDGHWTGNPAQRIAELRAQGHVIEPERTSRTDGHGNKRPMVVYRLTGSGTGGSEVEEASVVACCGPDQSEGDAATRGGESSAGASTSAPVDPPRLFEVEPDRPANPYEVEAA